MSYPTPMDVAFASENERLRGLLRDIKAKPHNLQYLMHRIDAALAPTDQPTVSKCQICDSTKDVGVRPIMGGGPVCSECFAVWYETGACTSEAIRKIRTTDNSKLSAKGGEAIGEKEG